MKGSWKCSVNFFTLIIELIDNTETTNKPISSNTCFPLWNSLETNLTKWSRFPKERFLTQNVFAQSPLEFGIESFLLEIQQIIVRNVWRNRPSLKKLKASRILIILKKGIILKSLLGTFVNSAKWRAINERCSGCNKKIENWPWKSIPPKNYDDWLYQCSHLFIAIYRF